MSRARFLFLLELLFSCNHHTCVDAGPQYKTINVSVPVDTDQHDNPHLVCPPSKWYHILLFYLVNYFSHAATVRSIPGELMLSTIYNAIFALFLPYSGVLRGIEAIVRHGMFYSDELRRAARSGALCIVIRTKDWEPRNGQLIKGFEDSGSTFHSNTSG
ncbi:hypothetical protein AUP68_06364 [Ilyonectria robusta]